MATYTTLSPDALDDILLHYAIGTVVAWQEIPGGLANSNFKLTTTAGTFLLKICDEKTQAELETQIAVLEHLRRYDYPTAYPVFQNDGAVILSTPIWHGVIYDFLQGRPPEITPNVMRQIANALARLHQIPPIESLPAFSMGVSAMSKFFDEIRGTAVADHPFVSWLKIQLQRLTPYLNAALPTGIVHGDLFADNVLFNGDRLIGVIDFEEICHGALLLDIGMAIVGCCYDDQNRLCRQWARSFLESYNHVRPLTDSECERLDGFVQYAALSIAFWRFRQFNLRYPDANLAQKHLEMVDRIERWEPICLRQNSGGKHIGTNMSSNLRARCTQTAHSN